MVIPVQDDRDDIEPLNPADAYRRQADAINNSAPIYAELEVIDFKLRKVLLMEQSLVRRILAQNMDNLKGTQTRTNELVNAFVLSAARNFINDQDEVVDVSGLLLRLRKKAERMLAIKEKCERRLRALEKMADYCDRIMNWSKHEARLEIRR